MKKLLLLLLLLASVVGVASAVPPADGSIGPYYYPSNKPRSKRVAVVWEDRTSGLNITNMNRIRRVNDLELEPALEMLQAQGCDVHRYTTQWFEGWQKAGEAYSVHTERRELWNDIGSYYALVIVVSPHNQITAANGANGNTVRYICADSTNGQLLIYGGADDGAATSWADTAQRGVVDLAGGQWNSFFINRNGRLVTLPSMGSVQDTLWMQEATTGVCKWDISKVTGATASGIDSVVRLYSLVSGIGDGASQTNWLDWTVLNSGTTPNESLQVVTPAANDSVARVHARGDTTGLAATEYLGPAWRVRFHLATQNLPNSLGSSAPRDVYWFKAMNGKNPARIKTDMLWGLICRFVNADPIRWAYENDDMADQAASNNAARRTSSGAADSTITLLHNRYGVNLVTAVLNPHHAYQYATAGESPWYESSWPTTLARIKYWQNNSMAWIHHAHDTTSWSALGTGAGAQHVNLETTNLTLAQAGYGNAPVMLGGNLVGRYGGYGPGNAVSLTQGGAVTEYCTDRVASRWDPNSTPAITDWGVSVAPARTNDSRRAGIVQRLAYSDSIRRVVCPQCPLPPYLNFPNAEVLPINYRKNRPSRPGANAAWTMYGTGSTDSLLCPIDSLLWAFDYSLNGRQQFGTGTVYLRGVFDDPKDLWIGGDRDSFPASIPWLYPREPWTTKIGGRTIQSSGINAFLVGAGDKASYFGAASSAACRVLGFQNGIIHSEMFDAVKGESYDVDINNFNNRPSAAPPIQGSSFRHFRPQQSSRVIYQHGFSGGYPINGNGSYDIEYFDGMVAQRIHAISVIAGRPATSCVAPWLVYGHN